MLPSKPLVKLEIFFLIPHLSAMLRLKAEKVRIVPRVCISAFREIQYHNRLPRNAGSFRPIKDVILSQSIKQSNVVSFNKTRKNVMQPSIYGMMLAEASEDHTPILRTTRYHE